jgi:hypothetical protein
MALVVKEWQATKVGLFALEQRRPCSHRSTFRPCTTDLFLSSYFGIARAISGIAGSALPSARRSSLVVAPRDLVSGRVKAEIDDFKQDCGRTWTDYLHSQIWLSGQRRVARRSTARDELGW